MENENLRLTFFRSSLHISLVVKETILKEKKRTFIQTTKLWYIKKQPYYYAHITHCSGTIGANHYG